MNKLTFIGTGAGDAGVLKQEINTSALYFEIDGLKFILDPGPGTIVNARKYNINLTALNGLIVTHPHPDHYTDANSLIDALYKPNSFLIAGKKCLDGSIDYLPCIGKFQQGIPAKVIGVASGDKVKIGNITFEATPNDHVNCGLGIKIMSQTKIGYLGDGSISKLEEFYQNMDLLIFNVLIPYTDSLIRPAHHTSTDQVIDFLKKTKPKKAIIQHFSEPMIKAGIEKQAKLIQEKTGIETIAAKDGYSISFR